MCEKICYCSYFFCLFAWNLNFALYIIFVNIKSEIWINNTAFLSKTNYLTSNLFLCGDKINYSVCHLPYGPTAYFNLSNVVLRHDIPGVEKMSEAYPHLIFHGFTSRLGQRCTNILKARSEINTNVVRGRNFLNH